MKKARMTWNGESLAMIQNNPVRVNLNMRTNTSKYQNSSSSVLCLLLCYVCVLCVLCVLCVCDGRRRRNMAKKKKKEKVRTTTYDVQRTKKKKKAKRRREINHKSLTLKKEIPQPGTNFSVVLFVRCVVKVALIAPQQKK